MLFTEQTDILAELGDSLIEPSFWEKVFDINTWKSIFTGMVIPYGLKIVIALLIWLIGSWILRRLMKLVNKAFSRGKIDETVGSFLTSVIKILLYVLLVFIILQVIGIATASIIAVLGSVGLTVGLALQGSLSNFAGGVLILLLRPFRVGDYIIAAGEEGTVNSIDIFYTKLITPDNRDIVIPNGTLSNTNITNVSAEKTRRQDIVVSASYSADIDEVKKILTEMADNCEYILKDQGIQVFVKEYAANSVDYDLRFWTAASDYWTARYELTENVKKTFDAKGIEIPFNQMEVNIKNMSTK